MASGGVLYLDFLSQPSRAVVNMMEHAGIASKFTIKEVSIMKGELREKEFAQINPNMRVPCYKEGGLILFESSAIMRYICNAYLPENNPYYPRNDPLKKAKIEELICKYHRFVRPAARAIYGTFIAPMLGVEHLFNIEEDKAKAILTAKEVEKWFIGNNTFLTGDQPSIADFLIYNELMQIHQVNDWSLKNAQIPKVKKMFKSLIEHASLKNSNNYLLAPLKEMEVDISYL